MLHQQFWVDRQADELLAGFVDGLFRLHGENWVRIFSQRAAGEKRQEATVPLAKVHPDLRRSDAQLEPKNGMLFCFIRKMCRFRAILIVQFCADAAEFRCSQFILRVYRHCKTHRGRPNYQVIAEPLF
jgi:hypothetical protein